MGKLKTAVQKATAVFVCAKKITDISAGEINITFFVEKG